jgi:hypothetical protein
MLKITVLYKYLNLQIPYYYLLMGLRFELGVLCLLRRHSVLKLHLQSFVLLGYFFQIECVWVLLRLAMVCDPPDLCLRVGGVTGMRYSIQLAYYYFL